MNPPGKPTEFRKFWAVLLLLAVLTPAGLYLPELFKAGGAWGEWGVEEVQRMIGYAPAGMKRHSELWKAPMPDYAFPGKVAAPVARPSVSYVLSALVGIAACGGGAWILGRWLTGKKK
jgi:cobalt/nickel transport protein